MFFSDFFYNGHGKHPRTSPTLDGLLRPRQRLSDLLEHDVGQGCPVGQLFGISEDLRRERPTHGVEGVVHLLERAHVDGHVAARADGLAGTMAGSRLDLEVTQPIIAMSTDTHIWKGMSIIFRKETQN